MLRAAGGSPGTDVPALDATREFILNTLAEEIIDPTAKAVERDLRLQIHAVKGVAEHNARARDRKPLNLLLALRPLRVFNEMVDVRERVRQYLQVTFYNLTTVFLHDWRTYSEMASLAADKFGLFLQDSHLPMGSLDTGIDVLQIMRNIHVFVRRFNYNLNQQLFVEKKAERGAKHMNVVNIDSICNSIRTHGTGMMSTTVSFAFQFLKQKLHLFSQFLFDDNIKSYLSRVSARAVSTSLSLSSCLGVPHTNVTY